MKNKVYLMDYYQGLRWATHDRYPKGTIAFADTKDEVIYMVSRIFKLSEEDSRVLRQLLEEHGWNYCFSDLEERTVEIRPIAESRKKEYRRFPTLRDVI